ncbi:thioredoxin family protein [Salirhabdus salicampi]|uniref:thioredoxin family protein n=1 Tax=Salirhabdus salicampi TaxID=476102 RepID=UPI0020C3B602|nr:thioredoxin family protein [Salirhabdus salicampi]MCP8617729.1 thioredoxin family protein [Salirhabdus salicampi]
MKEITKDNLAIFNQEVGLSFIFIYTPFCGTCNVARKMLNTIEQMKGSLQFHAMNASLFPHVMQQYKIKSVPCLIVFRNGIAEEKIYAFHSVPYMYEKLQMYLPS